MGSLSGIQIVANSVKTTGNGSLYCLIQVTPHKFKNSFHHKQICLLTINILIKLYLLESNFLVEIFVPRGGSNECFCRLILVGIFECIDGIRTEFFVL